MSDVTKSEQPWDRMNITEIDFTQHDPHFIGTFMERLEPLHEIWSRADTLSKGTVDDLMYDIVTDFTQRCGRYDEASLFEIILKLSKVVNHFNDANMKQCASMFTIGHSYLVGR
jgi:hypothetical protein